VTIGERVRAALGGRDAYPEWVAYEPELIPPPRLMRDEGITVIEEWFRWAEEWSMLLRVYGRLGRRSRVLEIGCGLGRIAFALRYLLAEGAYTGFEIVREKVEFLQRAFTSAHANFAFVWADVANTYYNPNGRHRASEYVFPAADASQDLVYAASVLTHMAPENAERYVAESARVLRPGGRCLLSVFVLDNYRPGVPRPSAFGSAAFAFDHGDGAGWAYVVPENPEQMTAFSEARLRAFADAAGLRVVEIVPGMWSGSHEQWVGMQDLLVLERPA
jgi:SAM-dependent methyltransferase